MILFLTSLTALHKNFLVITQHLKKNYKTKTRTQFQIINLNLKYIATSHFEKPKLSECYMRNDNAVIVKVIEIEQFGCLTYVINRIRDRKQFSIREFSLLFSENFSVCTYPSDHMNYLTITNKQKTSAYSCVNLIGSYVHRCKNNATYTQLYPNIQFVD